MARRVGFYRSWMDLRLGDLGRHDLAAFNVGLSVKQKASLTLGLVLLSATVLVLLEPWAGAVILFVGIWVIWNANNQVTKFEKKVFITAVVVSVFLALVEKASVFLNAAGLFALVLSAYLVYVWRR